VVLSWRYTARRGEQVFVARMPVMIAENSMPGIRYGAEVRYDAVRLAFNESCQAAWLQQSHVLFYNAMRRGIVAAEKRAVCSGDVRYQQCGVKMVRCV